MTEKELMAKFHYTDFSDTPATSPKLLRDMSETSRRRLLSRGSFGEVRVMEFTYYEDAE